MATPDVAIRVPVAMDDAWEALRDLLLAHLHDGHDYHDADAVAATVKAAARDAKAELVTLYDGNPALVALIPGARARAAFLVEQLDAIAARTRPREAMNGFIPCVALGDGAVHEAGGRYEQVVPLAFAYRTAGGELAWYWKWNDAPVWSPRADAHA